MDSMKKSRNATELKKEVFQKTQGGIKLKTKLMYGKSPSTVNSILAKIEKVNEANVASGVNILTKDRSQTI